MDSKKKPVVFMLSGQGSQYYHMGAELFERNKTFSNWFNLCDEIFRSLIGESIKDIVFSPMEANKQFDDIKYTNPALFSIQYSMVSMLLKEGFLPDYFLGYSIGELAAASVSGVLDLDETAQFLVKYSEILKSQTPDAGMLAILGDVNQVFSDDHNFPEKCWVSGLNFDNHFVISGEAKGILACQEALNKRGIVYQRLPVNIGFHSSLMDPVEKQIKEEFQKLKINKSTIPIISCVTQEVIDTFDENHFWKVTRQPVNFLKTVRDLFSTGDYQFVDVGPSGTLATFMKYVLSKYSQSEAMAVMNMFGKNVETLSKCTQRIAAALS